MNDLELLKSAKLWAYDKISGEEGINLAGILIFGKDELIVRYYLIISLMHFLEFVM